MKLHFEYQSRWIHAVIVSVLLHAAASPVAIQVFRGPALPLASPHHEPAMTFVTEPESLEAAPARPPENIKPVLEPPPEVESMVYPQTFEILDEPPPTDPPTRPPPSLSGLKITIPDMTTSSEGPKVAHYSPKSNTVAQPPESLNSIAEPAEIADPVAPAYPDLPPSSLLSGLPGSAFGAGKSSTVLSKEQQQELRRRLYNQTYYPDSAADLDLEGMVVVGFRLNDKGQPIDVSVTNRDETHTILQEEAIAMVMRGAPYPVPVVRRALNLFLAVAYLNTTDSPAERIQNVLPTGIPALDDRVNNLAAQDAVTNPKPGWHIVTYPVTAQFELHPGRTVTSSRLIKFGGDKRLRRTILECLPNLMEVPGVSGVVKVPIQFRIIDR
jgi:TonB family protein